MVICFNLVHPKPSPFHFSLSSSLFGFTFLTKLIFYGFFRVESNFDYKSAGPETTLRSSKVCASACVSLRPLINDICIPLTNESVEIGITFHKDISHVWFSVYPSSTEVERVTTTSACRLLWASYNMLATGKAPRDLWEANLMPCKLIWRDPPVRSQ